MPQSIDRFGTTTIRDTAPSRAKAKGKMVDRGVQTDAPTDLDMPAPKATPRKLASTTAPVSLDLAAENQPTEAAPKPSFKARWRAYVARKKVAIHAFFKPGDPNVKPELPDHYKGRELFRHL